MDVVACIASNNDFDVYYEAMATWSRYMRKAKQMNEATAKDTRGERIGNYWILRAPDPFGIPLSNPWEVLKLSSCIYPKCEGSCYKIEKAFKTEDEARGWVLAQNWSD